MMHANCIPYNSKTIVTKRSLIRNRAIAYILIFACLISCIVQTDASIDPTGPTPEADPNVALEGQCVVVCDAEPVAVKAARIQDREINAAGQNPATKLWENMRCSCGDIGTTFCRNQKVAFSAIRGTSLTTPEIQPILLFDYVILNDGNGFEVSTGSFRAPVTGVYSFSFQIFRMSNPDTLNVHLKKNAVTVFRGFADGNRNGPTTIKSAQNGGLLHLDKGDSVYLQSMEGDMSAGWMYSTFSGHLVYEDEYA